MAEDASGKVVWFVAGVAIGATVALLYAPQPGKQTRRILVKKTAEGRDAVVDTSKDVYERGKEIYEKSLEIADDAAELFERGKKLVRG
ncbi:MAG: YtxH domain-containing protein [Bryobacterales bacterium]|nr:YtxH domain-containing protein [Bryobacterales bacterium]